MNWTSVREATQTTDRPFDLGNDSAGDRNIASALTEPGSDEVPNWLEEAFRSKGEPNGEREVMR
jgi:hypothetical protein